MSITRSRLAAPLSRKPPATGRGASGVDGHACEKGRHPFPLGEAPGVRWIEPLQLARSTRDPEMIEALHREAEVDRENFAIVLGLVALVPLVIALFTRFA